MNYFNNPLLKIPLVFGLATSLAVFLLFLGLTALDIRALYVFEKYPFYFGIHLIMMCAAVWYYRRNVGKGLLHMWEGLMICYIINTVAALAAGWLMYGYVELIDPAEFKAYIQALIEFQESDKARFVKEIGAEDYNKMLAQTRATQPGILPKNLFVKSLFLGVLPILIISLVFRKQDYSPLR